jgi:hypothetical protein
MCVSFLTGEIVALATTLVIEVQVGALVSLPEFLRHASNKFSAPLQQSRC